MKGWLEGSEGLFSVGVGLCQGCSLLQILFVIFMKRVSRLSQGEESVQFALCRCGSVGFRLWPSVYTGALCNWVWSIQDETWHLQVWGHGSLPENGKLLSPGHYPNWVSSSISGSCSQVTVNRDGSSDIQRELGQGTMTSCQDHIVLSSRLFLLCLSPTNIQ